MLKSISRRSLGLASIFFTVFLDQVGVGIVIPVISVVVLRDNGGIVPVGLSYEWKTFILGVLIAVYPLAQFIGSPILGAISDHVGRRKVLLTVLIGTCLGYVLFALGIVWNNLALVFFSRVIDGFGGGSLAVAVSAVADVSDEESKPKNFGLVGTAFGLGFILGPWIGGQLSDPTTISWFTYATPFWFAAGLCALNIALVFFWLPETLKTSINTPVSVWTGVRNIRRALAFANLRTMFIVSFVLTFGFSFFAQFFQVFLIEKFQFTQKHIGYLFAYIGLWVVVSQVILRLISKRVAPARILAICAFCLGLVLPFLVIPSDPVALLFLLPFIAIFQGIIQPTAIAIVSNLASRDSQGEVMGIYQSVQSLGIAIPPIIAGLIVSLHIDLPTLVASGCTFAAWLIFIVFFRKAHQGLFVEV